MAAVPILTAARELGCSRKTVERMLQRGAPFVRVRGKRHVDVAELDRWSQSAAMRAVVVAIAWAAHGNASDGYPAWKVLALPEAESLTLLLLVYERVAAQLGEESRGLPVGLRHIESRIVALRQRIDRSKRR